MHTRAPNSMSAAEKRAPFSVGNSASASRRSRAEGAESATPCTTLAMTRRTLVSTTGTRCPYPKQAMARAV
ncbi:Uncharacterised protein [Mycobacteroides abscessus subsp. abscessus]|nr:Uncharacterised protein [Mycobacteroides abscessus subsp. abscessus]